ncbi:MAG: oligosaccharide flippase family protein [Bacteroidaceae bacterium]|nr:oligosaccharide flippase family protein [Bacteroidaceae bacterium]
MANKMAALAKDTAIYGISSIVGRFINYLLTPLYTRTLTDQSEYGQITSFYAWTAFLLVFLTFGMETTMFRFANKEGAKKERVFSTTLIFVGTLSFLFAAACFIFTEPISSILKFTARPDFIRIMAMVVALDAFQAVIFSYLRLQKRPLKFAGIKLSIIFLNIGLNLLFIYFIPKYFTDSALFREWFNTGNLVLYAFLINLFCSAVSLFAFIPELKELKFGFDAKSFREMFAYTLPILILGLAGILNQVADKMLYPHLVTGQDGQAQLGEYGAAVKIAMIMSMLIQAFRYAYEPMVFSASGESTDQKNKMYSDTMKYFIIFALLAFLTVVFYLDILLLILGPNYRAGAKVIPIVMIAEIFMGIYFNLSFWYKLTDRTWWGGVFSFIGCAVLIAINILFVPRYGYIACAWGGFAGYGVCMLLSYFVGQHYQPVKYPLKEIFIYTALAAALWGISSLFRNSNIVLRMGLNTIMLIIYVAYIVKKDLPLRSIPFVKRFCK